MKYKNRKIKTPILAAIIIVVLALVGTTVFAVSGGLSRYPKELVKKDKASAEAGSYKIFKKVINDDYYVLHYPSMGDKDLDAWIQETMDQTVERYTNEFDSDDSDTKHTIKQSFESKTSFKRYNSVKLKTYVDEALVAVESKTFDTKDKKFLTLDFMNNEGKRLVNYELRQVKPEANLERSEYLKQTNVLSNYENIYINDTDLNIETTFVKYNVDLKDKGAYLNEDFGSIKVETGELPSVYLDYGYEKTDKMVALTFDDGPYSANSLDIFAKLKENDAKGTFYILGSRIKGEEASLKQLLNEGHQLASHSYDHPDFNLMTVEEIDAQLQKTVKEIEKATGFKSDFYVRPPYGNLTEASKLKLNYTFTNWSVDTNDWLYRDAQMICDTTMDYVFDGAIVLMHELYAETTEALDCMLPKLKAEGYQMVTVKELLEAKGNEVKFGQLFFDAN